MAILSFSSGKVFIVYTDGVTSHGAVFQRRRGVPEQLARATSSVPDPAAAAAELHDKLKAQTSLPKEVFIATDRSVLMNSSLPVDPSRPRPYAQMRELARWEAEPMFSELPDWSIDRVLRATGRITEAQHKMITAEIEHTQRPGTPAARYQDVAIRLGYLDRSGRDFAIDAQERLSQQVEAPACAWRPTAGDGAAANQFAWQIAAMPAPERQAWNDGFKAKRIKLATLFAGWGLGSPDASEGASLVLERHSGAIFTHSVSETGEQTFRLFEQSSATSNEATAIERALDGALPETVTAIGFEQNSQNLIQDLAPMATFKDDWPQEALLGLAHLALETSEAPTTPRIAPKEPPKPLYKNADFWRVALLLGVALTIAGFEGYNRYRLSSLQARLEDLKVEYAEKRDVADRLNALVQKIDNLKDQVTDAYEVASLAREVERNAAYLQDRRSVLPVGILEAVRDAAHGGLVMQSISESKDIPEVFIATAWSVTELGAEQFISALNKNLAPLGLSVADESVFRQSGLRGIDGYSVKLRIAKSPAETRAEARE